MGKIFGIADLPVSTIMTPFEPIQIPEPMLDELDYVRKKSGAKFENYSDTFVPRTRKIISNPVISMRNGFGKLMSHFSKVK